MSFKVRIDGSMSDAMGQIHGDIKREVESIKSNSATPRVSVRASRLMSAAGDMNATGTLLYSSENADAAFDFCMNALANLSSVFDEVELEISIRSLK